MSDPCATEGCDRDRVARGLCDRHYRIARRAGTPLPPDARVRDQPGYLRAHERVYLARGRAADHPCQKCGGKARDWAYDGTDPDAIPSPTGGEYSLDPERYIPLCRRCHIAMDRDATRCKYGHEKVPGKNCATCLKALRRERRALMHRAAAVLGITYTEYRRQYGWSKAVAREIIWECDPE